MKIPNASNLAQVIIIPPDRPFTFKDETDGLCIVLVMKDGTVGEYENDGGMVLHRKYDSVKESYFENLDDVTGEYIEEIQQKYPSVEKIYLQPL